MKKINTVQVFGNEIFKEQKLTIGRSVWIWEIAVRSTVFWMKQEKSFWNRKCRRRRKR